MATSTTKKKQNGTTGAVDMDTETMNEEVPELDVRTMCVTLIGTSPLICHSKRHLASQLREDQGLDLSSDSAEREPEIEYRRSLYPLPPDRGTYEAFVTGELDEGDLDFGFKAEALKKALVRAAKNTGTMPMTDARSAMFVYGVEQRDYPRIQSPDGPRMREATVSLPKAGTDLRYRGEFPTWAADVEIEFDAGLLVPKQIPYLVQAAGFGVGIGDWRPEKDGQFGRFRPAEAEDLHADWYTESF